MQRRTRYDVKAAISLATALLLVGCGGGPKESSTDTPTVPVQNACATIIPASSATFNVKDVAYGAKGDGVTDDTAALQRAINAAGGTGGTVMVPDGIYLVNAVAVPTSGNHAIALKSNMSIKFSAGAVIQAKPNSADTYTILMISSISNVNVFGGTIIGERSSHLGTSGETGICVGITDSQHVVVQGLTAKDSWGDGFYIGGNSSDIAFCGVVADHNRRGGVSITRVNGMSVSNSTFKNTTGTLPESGLNVEPNSGETANQVTISGCTFTNNSGGGLQAGPPTALAGVAFVTNLIIDGNTFTGNGVLPIDSGTKSASLISNCNGTKFINNHVTNNTGRGLLLRDKATNTMVLGNTITGTSGPVGDGMYLSDCAGSTVSGNTVTGNSGHGIFVVSGAGATIGTNTVSGNGLTP